MIALALVAGAVVPAQAASGPAGEVFAMVNQQRAANSLPALVSDPTLDAAAQAWAQYLASNGLFEHSSSSWRSAMISGAGWINSGENIAAGYTTPASVMSGWMGSAGHRANILYSGYVGVGIGYVQGGPYGHYWVQIFANSNAPRVSPGNASVSGTPALGQPVTAATSGWPGGTNLSYAWHTNGAPIPGANGSTYIPTVSDTGRTLTVTVTGSKSGYYPGVRTSAPSAVVSGRPATQRLAGADRYATSVEISKAGFGAGVPVVYIASGINFPDGLAAAPAASLLGGPLLLTAPDYLPSSVADELVRLQPARIVVAGGTPSVSDDVLDALAEYAPTTRISGDDRFETSLRLVDDAFDAAPIAYISSGLNFPDALTAGAAAATVDAPVLLVNGGNSTLDSATRDLLQQLGVTTVRITGSTDSVSQGIQNQLNNLGYTVQRLSGPNRFDTAVAINKQAFTTSSKVYVALGMAFPDALAGSALAGAAGSPLFISFTGCMPTEVERAITALKPTKVIFFGGTNTLSNNVAAFLRC